jgi:phosphopantothenoylcysteine decarboxylase / phosphopantothenate---cysteine ligase
VKVALGVTGCIAAYKAIEVMRGLQKADLSVQVILTRSALKFVTTLTFESLSGRRVITGMFRPGDNSRIEHIRVAQEIQLLAVVPATANVLAKFASGIADDFLTTLYLSTPAPVLLAPAMNVEMWNHAAVRASVDTLSSRGHTFVNPELGLLACGMEGEGRLAETDTIVSEILVLTRRRDPLAGLKVLVTAGPTVEDIDPIRFISNRSSGKTGYALAQAARLRGAQVFLISGPTHLTCPSGVQSIRVRGAAEMKDAVLRLYPEMDIVVKAAAVTDYRPAQFHTNKVKKSDTQTSLPLAPTDDILAILGKAKDHQILIGFAAETQDLMTHAREKMLRKNLDLIVANDVSSGVFGEDTATVHILNGMGDVVTLNQESKLSIAHRLLDMALTALENRKSQRVPG